MKGRLVSKIISASWHRNGVGGVGFYAVLFESPGEGVMIASLFDEPGYCAVYKLDLLQKQSIEFAGGNSWRGDQFESELRPMVEKFLAKNGTNRIGPFSQIGTPKRRKHENA